MTNHRRSPPLTSALRPLARSMALVPALAVMLTTSVAVAEPPEQWADTDVAPIDALLVLFAIPAGLFLLIAVLVYMPSMARGERYQPGLAWRNEPEWFGGPRGGIESVDRAELPAGGEQRERGGTSARW